VDDTGKRLIAKPLPQEGGLTIHDNPFLKICGRAATFIPNSSFLIPHLRKAFIPNQGTARPTG
ncbi:MAG: hypothetical protein SOT66_04225, partial [Dialister sp.]|nr:hypothetical protein [Dialister sp.]